MAEPRITHAQMAAHLAYLASQVSQWSGSLLVLPEDYDKPVPVKTVNRFTNEMRGRLLHLDTMAGREKEPKP